MARHPGHLRVLAVPRRSRTYYYLVRSLRQGSKVSTEYLLNFGPLAPDQALNLKAWVEGLQANPWAPPPTPTDLTQLEFEDNLPGFRHGIVALGHAEWRYLGLPALVNRAFAGVKEKGFRGHLTEVMVLNRLEDPASKLRISEEWYGRTTLPFLLGLPRESWDEDDLYETLDVLDERRDEVEKLVYERVIKPLDSAAGVFLKDLTSTYFEGKGVGGTLLARGYSRDRVRGSQQVNWSVVLTPKGFPVTLEVYRGNTKDETTVRGTVERVKRLFGLKGGIFVGDRGMLTMPNLELLHAQGFQYLVAETLWKAKEVLAEARTKKREPLHPEGKQKRLDVGIPPEGKEGEEESWCEVADKNGRRHLCIFSRAKEKEELAGLQERLSFGKELEKWARAGIQRREWTEENHHDLVKSLTKQLVKKEADTLFDVVWDPKTSGTLFVRVNAERKAWEESKAGWWMLTTDTKLSCPEAVKLYKSLAVVERAFRTIKGPIQVRPVRHRLDRRIRAHLYVCLLAYLLERWLELKVREGGEERWAHVTGEQVLETVREGSVQQVGIRGTEIRRWKLARFTREAEVTLERLGFRGEGMKLPPMPTTLTGG